MRFILRYRIGAVNRVLTSWLWAALRLMLFRVAGRMRSGTRFAAVVAFALVLAPCAANAADMARCPFAAHNAYPFQGQGAEKLEQALEAGLKHIEVDVTYDARREAAVVTHSSKPAGGEPELGRFIEPIWRHWAEAPGTGYTLIVEFKHKDARIGRALQRILSAHADMLSRMSTRPGAPFIPGKITVCLTGNSDGQRAYESQLGLDDHYYAFGDVGYGPGAWKFNAESYVPREPPGFRRFITIEQHNLIALPFVHDELAMSPGRVEAVARRANAMGYQLRIYVLNAKQADQWQMAVSSAVPMIATDDYARAAAWWKAHRAR